MRRQSLKRRLRTSASLAIVIAALAATAAVQSASASAAWSVLVDSSHPGYAPDESYSLRGVAVSPDGSAVYGTWLHTGRGIVIDEYDAATGAVLHSSAPVPGSEGVDYVQTKAIAVDSRGYVFAGSGDVCYDASCDFPFIQAYSSDLQTAYGSVTTPGDPNVEHKRFGGLAAWDSGGHHYLYATRESGADGFYIQRFVTDDVNAPTLDTSFGTGGTLDLQDVLGGAIGHPHGIAVAPDGTIYVAAYDESAPPSATNGTVYEIAAEGGSATSASVPGAFGLALAGPTLYVSEYGEGPYPAVAVLDASTLAGEGSLDTGYANTNPSSDSGYSGIAVSPQGNLYLADQFYSSSSYSDRLLVSPRQPTSAQSCKQGGWREFTSAPGPFKNQGDCVSYFATGGKNR